MMVFANFSNSTSPPAPLLPLAASRTPSWSARWPSSPPLVSPTTDIFGTPIRNIIPRDFKGKQSKDAWSSCGSCHPDGLADGVTWIFGTGPRQTKPLDGMFNKGTNSEDQGLLNWSSIRGSNTDFNANS